MLLSFDMNNPFLILPGIMVVAFLVTTGCISSLPSGIRSPGDTPVTISFSSTITTPPPSLTIETKETAEPSGTVNDDHILPGSGDEKKLVIGVNSAVQNTTMPGFKPRSGNKIAVINVSITNNNQDDVSISRDQLFIQTERGKAYDHQGEIDYVFARNYLRFPITVHAGETITGPVVYIIFGGTRTNNLVLTDENSVVISMVDLNQVYQYG
jgi:hypothetical protein